MWYSITTNWILKTQSRFTHTKFHAAREAHSSHPWVRERSYTILHKQRALAKERHKQQPTNDTKIALREANINLTTEYKRLKDAYYIKIAGELRHNSREFYGFMRTKRRPANQLPLAMTYHGSQVVSGDRYKRMREHLESCFPNTNDHFPTERESFEEILNDIYRIHYSAQYENLWQHYTGTVTEDTIKKAIQSLSEHKDCGPMSINVATIKYCCDELLSAITILINGVISTGFVPSKWRHSFIVPIPKKGDTKEISNYRGIAIQSVVPKLLDKIMTQFLEQHLRSIIPTSQHGFMRKRSTISNLLEFADFTEGALVVGSRWM